MRSLSAGLIAHLAGTSHTPALLVRLDLLDGTVLAASDHDRPLDFDLGDGTVT